MIIVKIGRATLVKDMYKKVLSPKIGMYTHLIYINNKSVKL